LAPHNQKEVLLTQKLIKIKPPKIRIFGFPIPEPYYAYLILCEKLEERIRGYPIQKPLKRSFAKIGNFNLGLVC